MLYHFLIRTYPGVVVQSTSNTSATDTVPEFVMSVSPVSFDVHAREIQQKQCLSIYIHDLVRCDCYKLLDTNHVI